MAFVRLVVGGFVVLTVIYVCVALYSRSVRRERLEGEWDANPPAGADMEARRTYVEQGMLTYYSSFRRRLVLLVYVVPAIIVTVILFVVNAN